jgi:2,3-bisphosphoglycerate-independent phosphoglycerate mutase
LKYVILVGDGMADTPVKELGGKTPLEAANIPCMDTLASKGELGLARTVKPGFHPGSEIANMAILGLDPVKYYTGRAPIEAKSIGVDLEKDDVAFRINLVTLSSKSHGLVMEDYCSDHITTQEARELIKALGEGLKDIPSVRVYPGIEYRHLMVIRGFENPGIKTTPPHDILGEYAQKYLPENDLLKKLIERSLSILKDHPINLKRRSQGKKEATAIWPWGQGKACSVPTLKDEYGITGAMISAVDLMKGLGMLRGMEIINVPGATGWIDTNYVGKGEAALDALSRVDLVYVHVEAPDEAGHAGLLKEKIAAIESFDLLVVGTILKGLESKGIAFRMLIMPDHPTPIAIRTHSSDPIPFVIYDSTKQKNNPRGFSEKQAASTGVFIEEGHTILARLLEK